MFTQIIQNGEGPTRLFIGGVHGQESLTTIKALKNLSESSVQNGKLIIFNFPPSEYSSTLERSYYNSKTGMSILSLIKEYEPEIYLELHCYRQESYRKLVDVDRNYRMGVPPLIELEEGVLIGSVSPLIRIAFFDKYDFSFVLEVPCHAKDKSLDVYSNVLDMVARSRDRFEILEKLESKYPSAIRRARDYFFEFSHNFIVLFKEVHEEIEKNDLKDSAMIKRFLMDKSSQMHISITENQAEMIVEAVLLFDEHYPHSEIRKSWLDDVGRP